MNAKWSWDPEQIKKMLAAPTKKYKYFITDSKEEFLKRLEIITNNALVNNKDNLQYLERMDKIRQVREGADIFEVYPWLNKDEDKE